MLFVPETLRWEEATDAPSPRLLPPILPGLSLIGVRVVQERRVRIGLDRSPPTRHSHLYFLNVFPQRLLTHTCANSTPSARECCWPLSHKLISPRTFQSVKWRPSHSMKLLSTLGTAARVAKLPNSLICHHRASDLEAVRRRSLRKHVQQGIR